MDKIGMRWTLTSKNIGHFGIYNINELGQNINGVGTLKRKTLTLWT
jgi:hypothetical protein